MALNDLMMDKLAQSGIVCTTRILSPDITPEFRTQIDPIFQTCISNQDSYADIIDISLIEIVTPEDIDEINILNAAIDNCELLEFEPALENLDFFLVSRIENKEEFIIEEEVHVNVPS